MLIAKMNYQMYLNTGGDMNKPLVIVTGASSGIGKCLAKTFSNAGYPLGLIARNLSAMQELNLENTICVSADVTNYNAVSNAIHTIENKLGAVDCIINNAGYAKGGDFTELSDKEHQSTINVNILGVIHGIEVVLPAMRERKRGTIINISSVADRHSRPNIATYAASKAAVKSLSESLRQANAKYGIRVCNIAPAKILTPMLVASHLNDDQVIDPEDFAKAILWVYEQPQTICIRDLVIAPTFYEP